MNEPTNEPTPWVLRLLGTDSRGRVGFIINPDASPAEIVAALHEAFDELKANRADTEAESGP